MNAVTTFDIYVPQEAGAAAVGHALAGKKSVFVLLDSGESFTERQVSAALSRVREFYPQAYLERVKAWA